MPRTTLAAWIIDAASILAPARAGVTRRAADAGCSRQSVYDHAKKVRAAVEAEHSGGPPRKRLEAENQQLRRENAQLWDWLERTVDFSETRRDEFAVTAAAMGLSLNQIAALLVIVLGRPDAPSRSAIHRTIQAAGRAAGRVLEVLDARCKGLILVGCLDEIFFHRRPILVAIEPASMVWFLGRKAADYQGETWFRALQPWSSLEYAVADAGTGVQAGIALIQRDRRQCGQLPLEGGLDVFHIAMEAKRVLAQLWAKVERSWENCEAAARKAEVDRRAGRDDRRWAGCSERAWAKAVAAFREYEAAEAGWRLAHSALQIVGPDGRINDRDRARERVESALPSLPGPEWSKVRGYLQAPGTWTFLERLHRQLREAEPRDDLRRELLRLWWLRRQRPRGIALSVGNGSGHVAHLVQMLVCHKREPAWQESYERVRRVLRRSVRASSAVECMNSILRMQQSRHRTVTQEMLDLKRLYWNTRPFREGRRRGRCPYEHLGVELTDSSFWGLLHTPPIAAG
jgi:hypothetical protein